jgi:hypothetical protein
MRTRKNLTRHWRRALSWQALMASAFSLKEVGREAPRKIVSPHSALKPVANARTNKSAAKHIEIDLEMQKLPLHAAD